MSSREQKIEAARAAFGEVRAGMTLGLGTGSTAAEFVQLLGESPLAREVRCTSTSKKTETQALSLGITVVELAAVAPLDLAIDGADEIDPALRLIKGRGGALLREKIVEQQARRFIVIADESKLVQRLGVGPLPVEVTPFAIEVLTRRFAESDLQPSRRMAGDVPFVTDEGNALLDVCVPPDTDIADVVAWMREHAGVIETGFFPFEATEAVIATADGVKWMRRSPEE